MQNQLLICGSENRIRDLCQRLREPKVEVTTYAFELFAQAHRPSYFCSFSIPRRTQPRVAEMLPNTDGSRTFALDEESDAGLIKAWYETAMPKFRAALERKVSARLLREGRSFDSSYPCVHVHVPRSSPYSGQYRWIHRAWYTVPWLSDDRPPLRIFHEKEKASVDRPKDDYRSAPPMPPACLEPARPAMLGQIEYTSDLPLHSTLGGTIVVDGKHYILLASHYTPEASDQLSRGNRSNTELGEIITNSPMQEEDRVYWVPRKRRMGDTARDSQFRAGLEDQYVCPTQFENLAASFDRLNLRDRIAIQLRLLQRLAAKSNKRATGETAEAHSCLKESLAAFEKQGEHAIQMDWALFEAERSPHHLDPTLDQGAAGWATRFDDI